MQPIVLSDFFNYRFLSAPRYTPNGKAAVFTVSQCSSERNSYENRLWFWDGALHQLTDLGKEKSFLWDDDNHLLFSSIRSSEDRAMEREGLEFTSFYRLDIRGGEAVHAFTLPFTVDRLEKTDQGYVALGRISMEEPDLYAQDREYRKAAAARKRDECADVQVLNQIPFWENGGSFINHLRTALFTVTPDGKSTRITNPDFETETMAVLDHKIYYTGISFSSKHTRIGRTVYAFELESGKCSAVCNAEELTIDRMIAVGKQLWLSATSCRRYGINENTWVYILDPATGTLTPLRKEECNMYGCVGCDCRYGGGEPWQEKGGSLYHLATREGSSHILRLDSDGTSHPVLTADGSADSFTLSENSDHALLVGLYNGHLQELYSLELRTGHLTQLTHFNDSVLEGKYVAEPQPVQVESCGLSIGGWVLLPKDFDSKKQYPAILDIHGGPKTVFGPVFFHEMQAWASMGYFVFFCNPKGSDGRDNEFADIRGHYGETDYQNLMDFTDAVLRKYPQIQSDRICVTGGSYGGFMTNWIIGHTDRFCCAASQRSISNWLSFHGVSDIGYFFATDQNASDFYHDYETLWAHSPLKYAANVKTPTLFIHSDRDYRCPPDQGLQMYTALVDRGIPTRLCMFHEENHELSRSGMPRRRLRRLEEMTRWFNTYSQKLSSR